MVIVILALIVGGAYYWLQKNNQEKSAIKKTAITQLALLTTGHSAQLYTATSSGMHASVNQNQFTNKFSGLVSSKPVFLPGKLVTKNGKYYYYQRVDNLPKTPGGRTNADFTLEYINEKGWKLNAVTIE